MNEEEKQSRRSKLFRHHIRLDSSKITNNQASPTQSPSPSLYSFSTPPVSLLDQRGEKSRVGRRATLPLDYRAPVATLPHIATKEPLQETVDVTELALPKFDSDGEISNYFLKETS